MAIETVETSLEMSFEELVTKFGEKLDDKLFYELSSVLQGLRPSKDVFHETIGPVHKANLHSNPDDPPDVNLIIAEKDLKVSVEHTDFNNPMRGYVSGLHISEFPSAGIFLPPVSQSRPISREETLKAMFNPGQNWTTPMQTTQATAFQLEECVSKKLKKFSPDFLVITDKLALDFNFDIAVMYVIARIREGNIPLGDTTIVFYSELDPGPTRFASYWVKNKGQEIRYRNSKGLYLDSLAEIQETSGLDRRWQWFRSQS